MSQYDHKRDQGARAWPAPGDEGYEEWLNGPRPNEGEGRGAWLAGKSAQAAQRKREEREAKGETGHGSVEGEARHVLRSILNDPAAHNADRIRAATELARLERGEREEEERDTRLHELRLTLALLPEGERRGALVEALCRITTGDRADAPARLNEEACPPPPPAIPSQASRASGLLLKPPQSPHEPSPSNVTPVLGISPIQHAALESYVTQEDDS